MARKIASESPSTLTENSAMSDTTQADVSTEVETNPSHVVLRKLDKTVDVSTLPTASVTFLLAYGLRQVVSDAAAGLLKAEGPEAAKAAMEAKLQSILDGTIGTRAPAAPKAPKVRSIDWFLNSVAKEKITALCQSKGATMPTGDKLKGFIAKLVETNQSVKDEAAKRFADATSGVQDVEDEFLNDLLEG